MLRAVCKRHFAYATNALHLLRLTACPATSAYFDFGREVHPKLSIANISYHNFSILSRDFSKFLGEILKNSKKLGKIAHWRYPFPYFTSASRT